MTEHHHPPISDPYISDDPADELLTYLRAGACAAWRHLHLTGSPEWWAEVEDALDRGDNVIIHPTPFYEAAQAGESLDYQSEVLTKTATPRYSFSRYEPGGRIAAQLVVEALASDGGSGLAHAALGWLEQRPTTTEPHPRTKSRKRTP